ncbi:MAG: hypothetical protein JO154_22360 [Chitinophaga sp.]|uniref:hypothetical protein n=1 Tax=Chitinophaga sp. TaxID=1869181 RepID=UPI0025C29040|nr:hypothetical protein [Chitinophaga sp.]MBV8255361.1 hypothetical protein [Chitinophaga sp.]
MKKILLGIFAVSMIISCSKPVEPMIPNEPKPGTGTDTPTPPAEKVKLYPVQILDPIDSFVYEYNTDKTMKRMAYFRHNSDGFHSYVAFDRQLSYENGRLTQMGNWIIYYNSNGEMVDAPGGTTRYVFDAQHRQTEMYYGTELVEKLYWDGKNIIKQERYASGRVTSTREYKYDKAPNGYYSLLGAISADYRTFYSENNVLEEKVTDGSGSYVIYYKYKYNDSGYPVEIEYHPDSPDGAAVHVTKITYTK